MARYQEKATGAVVKAVRFDPNVYPWPADVKSWPDGHGIQPRDMSFGYISGRQVVHVFANDWIVTNEAGGVLAYGPAYFSSEFEPLEEDLSTQPLVEEQQDMAKIADMTIHIDTSEEAQQFIQEIKDASLTEDRVRQITQEEIQKWQSQQMALLRAQGSLLLPYGVT